MNRRALSLIAAAAAYGAYRYSKMTPEQKTTIKERGKDFLNKNLGSWSNLFNKKKSAMDGNGGSGF